MIHALRPRFLPDRDAAREWGGKGAPLARLIRKGFAVPPSAAMGLGQVQGWLESLPEYAPAIESWRMARADMSEKLSALEQAILGAAMPEHWALSAGTLRRFLCGDPLELSAALEAEPSAKSGAGVDTWPMILRSSMSAEDSGAGSLAGCFQSVVVRETTAENLWRGFTQVVASAFELSSAQRLSAAGVDPRAFRAGVLIQPHLVAEMAGVCFSRDPVNPWDKDGCVEWVRGAGEGLVQGTAESWKRRQSEGASAELAPLWEKLWSRAAKAEKIVGGPVDLEWVWDGAQLWFVQARPIATEEARLAARAPKRRWTRQLTL
jgi:pyruvate,water dikinase